MLSAFINISHSLLFNALSRTVGKPSTNGQHSKSIFSEIISVVRWLWTWIRCNHTNDDSELCATDNIVYSSTWDAAEYVLSLREQGLTHDCVAAVISSTETLLERTVAKVKRTVSWFVFKTLMHSCYFCMMHPGVILGLRGSMLNGMTNVDTITSK